MPRAQLRGDQSQTEAGPQRALQGQDLVEEDDKEIPAGRPYRRPFAPPFPSSASVAAVNTASAEHSLLHFAAQWLSGDWGGRTGVR